MTQRLLCLGLGYCAGFLAVRLGALGWQTAGSSRSEAGLAPLRAAGHEAYRWSREHPLLPDAAWEGTTHLLVSAPPDAEGDPVLDLLSDRLSGLSWIGYLSSTGVYGDHEGAWVDEETPLQAPSSERARRRAAAEARWRALAGELPLEVFRLGGIYGPGRSPLDRVRAGRARRLDAPEHLFSRIHVEDVAGALRAAIEQPRPGRVLNLVDDEPATSATVTERACELLGVEPPPLVPFDLESLPPAVASFYRDRRRVRNARLREELGYELRYPTYREGLAALLLD
ncbi:MAG TPA: NAD(P)-dependent oxidoreductase [Planctomycetes bacterium]|nr:NAD(P)-dependent oxidoreductase [Planctomycetota bacterium]